MGWVFHHKAISKTVYSVLTNHRKKFNINKKGGYIKKTFSNIFFQITVFVKISFDEIFANPM